MRVVVCGDVCPTEVNSAAFIQGDANALFGDVALHIRDADVSVCNLECPLTNVETPMRKSGPNLKAKPDCVCGLQAAGFTVVGLANNHIRDYGDAGVFDTKRICDEAGIATVGAGIGEDATKVQYVKINGETLGIMAIADNECSSAGAHTVGANGFDVYTTLDQIQQASSACDYLLILYHSGLEHYAYPSPELQKRCKKMADCGADAIICQHSHCIGSQETYDGCHIVYGQGNCLFYLESAGDTWNTSLIITIDTKKNAIEYSPAIAHDGGARLANKQHATVILREFEARSSEITSPSNVLEHWHAFNASRAANYYAVLLGFPRLLRILNKLLKNRLARLFLNKKRAIVVQNCIRCESHRESLLYCIDAEMNRQ